MRLLNDLKSIIGVVLFIIAIILTLVLYDYKLLIILFVFLWANNIDQSAKK